MSKESIYEKPTQVKRKVRTIPDGMRLTITEVRRFPKRTRGPDKNILVKIRRRYIKYIAACPYLNSNEKLVIIKIAEWFNLKDGFTRAAYVTLAESVGVSTATVKRALRTAYDAGLMGIKSGGQSRKGSFGPVANKYVPAFRLVINPANNLLIENAPYHFLPRTVNGEAKSVGQKPEGQIDPIVETRTVNVEAKSLGQIDPLHANVGGAKNAQPLGTADTAPDGSATRPKEESGEREVRYIPVKALADELDMTFEGLIELFTGKGSDQDIENLDDFCKAQIFTFGKPTSGILKHKLPSDVFVYGHVVIHGCKGKVTFVETGNSTLLLKKKSNSTRRAIGPDNWLAIDYRVSPAYQIEAAAKVQELKIGI